MSKKRQPIKRPVIRPKRGPKPKAVAPKIPKILTAKQQRFIEEYLVDVNATQAAIRAGYSAKTANEQSSRLLANVKVRAAVDEALAKRSKRTEITADRVLWELGRVGFSDLRGAFDEGRLRLLEDMDDEMAPAIASIKVITRNKGEGEVEYVSEVKAWDKVSALAKLMPHVGLTTEKSDVDLKVVSEAAIVERVRQMSDEDLAIYDAATRVQEALLAKAKGKGASA